MIRSFKSRALKRFWQRDDPAGLRPDWVARIRRQLNALDVAIAPEELDRLGWGWHRLTGDRAGRWSLTVSRNWRLTFGWQEGDAVELDLEDYHGA